MRLFPTGTQYPAGSPITALLKSHCRGRQCSLFCLFAPFPHGYIVSRGVPDNCAFEITLLQAIMLTLLLVCAFSPRKYKSILRGFYNAVSLPGDCHVASLLAMTEYFVRNVTRVCLPESNSKIYVRSLCFSVQRTLCHCERSVAISRKGYLINFPKGKQTP